VELGGGLHALVADVLSGVAASTVSARFHNGIAQMVVDAASQQRADTGIDKVVLSGGVWQNLTLMRRTLSLLRSRDFSVYLHREVPTNDGGLSLGQAAVAACRLRAGFGSGSPATEN
jgi:hydrogenase maturation protein HypF